MSYTESPGFQRVTDVQSPEGLEALNRALEVAVNENRLGSGTAGTKAGSFDGVYAQFTGTGANDVVIQHQLGRTPVGFIVTSQDGDGNAWAPSSSKAQWDSKQVVLRGTSGVTFTCMIH